ncbi:hypothetical protein DL95DRAFT_398510, partial [Leptodontidium sp. 2 PMI_412]
FGSLYIILPLPPVLVRPAISTYTYPKVEGTPPRRKVLCGVSRGLSRENTVYSEERG